MSVEPSIDQIAPPARAIVQLLMSAYQEKTGHVHVESILGAAAALAGTFALKAVSEGKALPDTGWVIGRAPDALLYADEAHGQLTVWSIIKKVVSADPAVNLPKIEAIADRIDAQVGRSPFPPLSIPREHYPHEWSPNASVRFGAAVDEIAANAQLTLRETTLAIGIAIGMILAQARGIGIDMSIATTLIGEIMLGTSRMAPLKQEILPQ